MFEELTHSGQNSLEARSTRSNDSAEPDASQHRLRSLDRQGACSGPPRVSERLAPLERVLPATAAAGPPGGAPLAKRARRSRPWNVSQPAAVVAPVSIRDAWLSNEEAMPRPGLIGAEERCLPASDRLDGPAHGTSFDSCESVTTAGTALGEPCDRVARKGNRILGSSVQRAFGRGRPRGRLLLCV
jgi:hypothetical protein